MDNENDCCLFYKEDIFDVIEIILYIYCMFIMKSHRKKVLRHSDENVWAFLLECLGIFCKMLRCFSGLNLIFCNIKKLIFYMNLTLYCK